MQQHARLGFLFLTIDHYVISQALVNIIINLIIFKNNVIKHARTSSIKRRMHIT